MCTKTDFEEDIVEVLENYGYIPEGKKVIDCYIILDMVELPIVNLSLIDIEP